MPSRAAKERRKDGVPSTAGMRLKRPYIVVGGYSAVEGASI